MKVLIIAGGTGGHIFPGLAVAQALQQQQVDIHWLGSEIGLERQLVSPHYSLTCIAARQVRGKRIWNLIATPWFLLRSTWQAWRVIKKLQPDVVLAMGGFVSAPGGIATKLARKPLVLHEQNAVAGYTNRILARFADVVLSAFPKTFPEKFHPQVVGNPVRSAIAALPPPSSSQLAGEGFNEKIPLNVLILGGSQGARAINRLVMETVNNFKEPQKLRIWHQTGKAEFELIKNKYQQIEVVAEVSSFIQDMASAYDWADLVISRSGALTVSELAAAGVASILIPFPYAVDDHQWHNGRFLRDADAAILLREAEISPECLNEYLLDFIRNRNRLLVMAQNARQLAKPQAVFEVAQVLQKIATKKRSKNNKRIPKHETF